MAAVPKPNIAPLKKLVPLFNRVLIRKHDAPKETDTGIVLPDSSKETVRKGTVVAVGPGSTRDNGNQIPVSVKPGDEVLLPDFGGTKVELEGKQYYLFRESEILAKLM